MFNWQLSTGLCFPRARKSRRPWAIPGALSLAGYGFASVRLQASGSATDIRNFLLLFGGLFVIYLIAAYCVAVTRMLLDLPSAERIALAAGDGFRLPEPTRRADRAVAEAGRARR